MWSNEDIQFDCSFGFVGVYKNIRVQHCVLSVKGVLRSEYIENKSEISTNIWGNSILQ